MKAIILAAGQGTRLRPLTNDCPKCMVEFKGKPIIDYIIETMFASNLVDINVVTGYLDNVLKKHLEKYKGISFYHNESYMTTNMVHSLWCAKAAFDKFDDAVIVSYSDIIYSDNVLHELINSTEDISVVIDKDWFKLWKQRMDDPLQDAESLILDNEENILELGKKVNSYDKIQGQYIGLIKFSKQILPEIIMFYHGALSTKDIGAMYMTDFLQELINHGFKVKSIPIHGNWIEIDTVEDLEKCKFINLPTLLNL
jgi:choline kinase